MELKSTTEFELMTVIHLFEGMGLTKVDMPSFLHQCVSNNSNQYKELLNFATNNWKQ